MTWFLSLVVLGVVAIAVVALIARAAAGRTPAPELGVDAGRLQPCPDALNCVSSQEHPHDTAHYLPPLPFAGDPSRVVDAIDDVVRRRPRTERVARHGRYVRYAFQTYLMGFTDDVEFWVDDELGEVHFRSASRHGRDDLGTNRTRMRSLLDELQEALEAEGLAVER